MWRAGAAHVSGEGRNTNGAGSSPICAAPLGSEHLGVLLHACGVVRLANHLFDQVCWQDTQRRKHAATQQGAQTLRALHGGDSCPRRWCSCPHAATHQPVHYNSLSDPPAERKLGTSLKGSCPFYLLLSQHPNTTHRSRPALQQSTPSPVAS